MKNKENNNTNKTTRDYDYVLTRIREMEEVEMFGIKKSAKELPNILNEDEDLLYITSGISDTENYLVACTDRRVLFLSVGSFSRIKTKQIPLNKINSIVFKTSFMSGKISIRDGSPMGTIIHNIPIKATKIMASTIDKAIESLKINKDIEENSMTLDNNSDTKAKIESTKPFNLVEELEKLGNLKDKGILSEEEFLIAKNKLINNF